MPTVQTELIDLSKVDLLPDSRRHDPVKLETLAKDMAGQGQLQEIVVTPVGNRFQVIAGAGRTLAARKLGWKQIRASIRRNVSEFDRARITFSENENREDADAFYQAEQIQKMLRAKDYGRKELGKQLGISDSLIGDYIAVDGLPPAIKQNPRRLGINALVQIARINQSKKQIRLFNRCLQNDLSVRQIKILTDKILAKHKTARPEPAVVTMADPLAKVWEPLQMRAMASGEQWGVNYGPQTIPTMKGVQINGWQFWFVPMAGSPREHLATWLESLAAALRGSNRAAKPAAKSAPTADSGNLPADGAIPDGPWQRFLPANTQEMKQLETEGRNVRLPKNAAEWKELEQLVTQGPTPVYQWIYGAKSLMAQKVGGADWTDLGIIDPLGTTRQMVESLKKIAVL